MHPCLRVDEIVRHVASELVASKWEETVATFARCCKSFEDPALDALWETQHKLNPLLETFPEDVWNYQCDVGVPMISALYSLNHSFLQSFERLPTELEWARFRGYARRIRAFKGHRPFNLPSQVHSVLHFRAFSEPLFPNLRSLELTCVAEDLIPFIPLFLSPRTTSVHLGCEREIPEVVIASMVITFPTLCPNLQSICLHSLLRDPVITAAVSEMLLTTNRNTLQKFNAESPLTEKATKVICELPDLHELWLTIDRSGSLPTLALPNLTAIRVTYGHDHGWLQGFRRATLGKLTSVAFYSDYDPTDDFLEAFESVALTTSIPATLSEFKFSTSWSWRPNYHSLLPFAQLRRLIIEFICEDRCSSTIDDDIVVDLARAMPKLEILCIGRIPCETPTGVTAKGLAALAHYCPRLSELCIHFQVAGLDPSTIPQAASSGESTMPREDCALTCLHAGFVLLPEESILTVTQALLHIFPRLYEIRSFGGGWDKVEHAIRASRRLANHSSKKHPFATPRSNVEDTPPRSYA